MARRNGRNGRNQGSPPPLDHPTEQGGLSQHAQSQWIMQQLIQLTEKTGDYDGSLNRLEADVKDVDRRVQSIQKTIWIATGAIVATVTVVGFLISPYLSKLSTLLEAAAKAGGPG